MRPFPEVHSIATPLDRANVDTDQIVPKQFLKLVQKSGFGKFLFHDWRYDKSGAERPDFVLNDPRYRNSQILITGENFGCGSSREHAAWALLDYGFLVVISASFADIFYSNCIRNGILPVVLLPEDLRAVRACGGKISVSLRGQTVSADSCKMHFDIDPHERRILLEGLDEIAQTMQFEDRIGEFEQDSTVPSIL